MISQTMSEKGIHLKNQDSFYADDSKGLYAVADGVTLSGAGEEASKTAVSCVKNFSDMKALFKQANEKVIALGKGSTTFTVARINENNLEVGHVGDSCLFLVRDKVRKITETDASPGSRVLTQALGESEIVPHLYTISLKPGDIILLATDGVTKHLKDKEILDLLKGENPATELISSAREKPKLFEDDKTVIVVRV